MTLDRAGNKREYTMQRSLRYLAWHPIAGGNGEGDPPTPPAGDPPATPPTSGGSKDGDEKRFSQAELDAHIKERLDRERAKAAADAKKAEEAAEQKRLAEQQEWKQLAEKAQAQVTALEPIKAKAERFEAALTAQLETARKDLPAHVVELLDQLDPAAQLEYIAKHGEALGRAPAKTGGGVPETPKASGTTPTRDAAIRDGTKELQESGRYTI